MPYLSAEADPAIELLFHWGCEALGAGGARCGSSFVTGGCAPFEMAVMGCAES